MKEITDFLEAGIMDFFDSDRYKSWLNTMSRFHGYSLKNTLLIVMQKPDATLVAGYFLAEGFWPAGAEGQEGDQNPRSHPV